MANEIESEPDAITLERVLELNQKFQPWRNREETEHLYYWLKAEGIPFCVECADWHYLVEPHSMTFEVS